MESSFSNFIKPFKTFDQLLFTIYIFVNYKHLHTDTICSLLESLTNTVISRFDVDSFLRQFNIASEYYGIDFFSTLNNLPEKIEVILGNNEKIQ